MNEDFLIYIDRLKDGKQEIIKKSLSPAFIDVEEKDLHFRDTVYIEGKAYLADQHLILQLHVSTYVTMPCLVCNQDVKVKIETEELYHAEDIEDIKSHIFDFSSVLRENILLLVPQFVECDGNCPERTVINKFLKSSHKTKVESPSSESKHFPFSNL